MPMILHGLAITLSVILAAAFTLFMLGLTAFCVGYGVAMGWTHGLIDFCKSNATTKQEEGI